MKVLVIGGSSFIGTNLLLKSPNNWDIIATYNNSSKFTEKFINKKNIRFLKLDLINENLEDFDFFDIVYKKVFPYRNTRWAHWDIFFV